MGMCLIESSTALVTGGKDTHVRVYDVQTNQVGREKSIFSFIKCFVRKAVASV